MRDQSVNRQRKAKVVLGAMLDLAVRHDAIPTSPVHRPKQETKALRVRDLSEIRAAVRRWINADRSGPKATGDMADIIDLMLATGCRIGEILALRWSDLDLDGELPILTVSGTIKTSDASRRTVVLPRFVAELLRVRREFATPNENDAVFANRNGTWHQVVNIERRWRQIRKDTGFEWVTPHTFRKTVATLISEAATSELASRQLGHSSSQVIRDHYIAKPPVSADLSELLERLAERDDASSDS